MQSIKCSLWSCNRPVFYHVQVAALSGPKMLMMPVEAKKATSFDKAMIRKIIDPKYRFIEDETKCIFWYITKPVVRMRGHIIFPKWSETLDKLEQLNYDHFAMAFFRCNNDGCVQKLWTTEDYMLSDNLTNCEHINNERHDKGGMDFFQQFFQYTSVNTIIRSYYPFT